MNEQVSAWLNVIEGLPDVHQRLRSVVILNQNALDVIRKQDGEHTLFYCDPPYLHETRTATGAYAHEMTVPQHRELLDVLANIQGKFMLSGYPSDLYAQWEKKYGWKRHDYLIDNTETRVMQFGANAYIANHAVKIQAMYQLTDLLEGRVPTGEDVPIGDAFVMATQFAWL